MQTYDFGVLIYNENQNLQENTYVWCKWKSDFYFLLPAKACRYINSTHLKCISLGSDSFCVLCSIIFLYTASII